MGLGQVRDKAQSDFWAKMSKAPTFWRLLNVKATVEIYLQGLFPVDFRCQLWPSVVPRLVPGPVPRRPYQICIRSACSLWRSFSRPNSTEHLRVALTSSFGDCSPAGLSCWWGRKQCAKRAIFACGALRLSTCWDDGQWEWFRLCKEPCSASSMTH